MGASAAESEGSSRKERLLMLSRLFLRAGNRGDRGFMSRARWLSTGLSDGGGEGAVGGSSVAREELDTAEDVEIVLREMD